MSDHKDTSKQTDELAQLRSLIGDTEAGQFELDDIMAEFHSSSVSKSGGRGAVPLTPSGDGADGPDLPWPEPPHRPHRDGNVVAFPGGEDEDDDEEDADEEPEDTSDDEPDKADNLIEFPEEESALSAFLKGLSQKADDYADQMFEDDENVDPAEVRRLESLIPGTDTEEVPAPEEEAPPPPPRRRPVRAVPPPPDYTPKELVRLYGKKLKGLRLRRNCVFLLALLALIQVLVPALGLVWYPPLDHPFIQSWTAVLLMLLGILLGLDVIGQGLKRLLHLRAGMDTLTALSCIFTLADGILLGLNPEGSTRLPYTVVSLAGLFCLLHGVFHQKSAMRLSCRTAAASSTPYRVTLDEGKWNGLDTYTKWSGSTEGFGSQIQVEDGAQQIYKKVCPLVLLGCVGLSLVNALLITKKPELTVWCLSATFTAAASFGAALVYARPFHKVARRLAKSGAVLAGWPGIEGSRRGNRVLITDTDLFPRGYVELNGYRVMPEFSAERVLAYTATLIRDSGSGLAPLFHDKLRAVGGLLRDADRLCCYEGGGLSANIRGDSVLVGSAAFMNLMEVTLPQGLNVKNAVFCAINGDLAGIFALNYTLPDTVFPALEELIEEKVGPVLATRDFNLIPAMLHQRFKLAAEKMDFPPVERRRELSDPDQPHSHTLTALLCREGLFPFAETIAAARRLRMATRLGAGLCCLSSVMGLCLSAYLTSVAAFTSLSPLNLLAFLLIWLVPIWFLSGWVHRY